MHAQDSSVSTETFMHAQDSSVSTETFMQVQDSSVSTETFMHVQDSSITTETFKHVQDSSKLLCMSRIVVHDGRCRELPAGCLELDQLQQSLAHSRPCSSVQEGVSQAGEQEAHLAWRLLVEIPPYVGQHHKQTFNLTDCGKCESIGEGDNTALGEQTEKDQLRWDSFVFCQKL